MGKKPQFFMKLGSQILLNISPCRLHLNGMLNRDSDYLSNANDINSKEIEKHFLSYVYCEQLYIVLIIDWRLLHFQYR